MVLLCGTRLGPPGTILLWNHTGATWDNFAVGPAVGPSDLAVEPDWSHPGQSELALNYENQIIYSFFCMD